MRNLRAARACLKHDLRRMLFTPRILAVLLLTGLFIQNLVKPIGWYLADAGVSINAPGLLSYLFSDCFFTLVSLMGLLLLLCDAPFYDETQQYVLLRCGRKTWGLGQVAYAFCATFIYLLLQCGLAQLFLAGRLDYGALWGQGMEGIVVGMEYQNYDIMIDLDPMIYSVFSPWGAFGLAFLLRWLAGSALVLIMYCINVAGGARLGMAAAAIPVFFDYTIAEFLPEWLNHFSPVSLSRLAVLDWEGGGFLTNAAYGVAALPVLACILAFLAVRLSRRGALPLSTAL